MEGKITNRIVERLHDLKIDTVSDEELRSLRRLVYLCESNRKARQTNGNVSRRKPGAKRATEFDWSVMEARLDESVTIDVPEGVKESTFVSRIRSSFSAYKRLVKPNWDTYELSVSSYGESISIRVYDLELHNPSRMTNRLRVKTAMLTKRKFK
jgi:hypothetical protein